MTSRRKTGRSSGKIRMMFWIELNAIVMVMKKRAPLRFWTPWIVPSQFWKRMMVKMAVMIVTMSLT